MTISPRLLFVTGVHAIFSQYGDIMSACFNLMNVPIRKFFNESLQENYGPMSDETFEFVFSSCASSMYVGLMIGFAVMGYLMDHVGRKETAVIIRGALGIAGSTCMVLAHLLNRCELYVIGHVLAGIVTGLKVVLIIYVAECSPSAKRGVTSMAVNSGGVIMVLLATPLCLPEIFGSEELWYLLPCICAILAITHLVIASSFPQSPKQLYVQQHDETAARHAIGFYYGENVDIDPLLAEMHEEKSVAHEKSATLIDVMRNKTYRASFFLVLLCAFIPVFSAINVKSQYLLSMLMSYGLSQSEATTAMMAISAISLPVSFIAPFFIEKYGRRPMFVTVTILCALEWAALGLAQMMVDVHATKMTLSWLSACVGSILGQSAVNMGLLIMSPIMISEICPHKTRAAISQLTQVFPIAFAVAEVSFFPNLRETFGASLFFFLGASCAALAVLMFSMMSTRPRVHKKRRLRADSDYSLWPTYGTISATDFGSVSSLHKSDSERMFKFVH